MALRFTDGTYTFGHTLETFRMLAPRVLGQLSPLAGSVAGAERLPHRTRVLLYLRMARLMGCPVCRNAFPWVGRVVGLTRWEREEALGGPDGFLDPEEKAALDLAGEILERDGELPEVLPESLSPDRVAQIQAFVRLEMVIHAIGLAFLPDGWIRKARAL